MRPVVGYEGIFSVTEDGRVYSHRTFKFLSQGTLHNGYKCISSKIGGRKGKYICLRVHRMVAEAYVSNPFNKPFVNHLDGVKDNNNAWNLEWCTAAENNRHAIDIGLSKVDHLIKSSKDRMVLSSDQVDYIKKHYIPFDREFGSRALSRLFGCCHSVISRTYNGRVS